MPLIIMLKPWKRSQLNCHQHESLRHTLMCTLSACKVAEELRRARRGGDPVRALAQQQACVSS